MTSARWTLKKYIFFHVRRFGSPKVFHWLCCPLVVSLFDVWAWPLGVSVAAWVKDRAFNDPPVSFKRGPCSCDVSSRLVFDKTQRFVTFTIMLPRCTNSKQGRVTGTEMGHRLWAFESTSNQQSVSHKIAVFHPCYSFKSNFNSELNLYKTVC